MAELILKLEIDPVTGKKNVLIDYGSDSDALPMEHEEDHRRLVDQLIEGGALKAADLGRIVIRRDGDDMVEEAESERTPLDERAAVGTTEG
ncbi:MAG: hypothetical protein H6737_02745 [Alphaproteobacteria bacterium]|nr:hypothetical protein [Alphaproteobacteria bacterium]